ncbi:MAG: nitroreductase/quinone reductase family protein [Solirubrobacterales bacterium]
MSSHTPFKFWNQIGNPPIRAILRSPLHGALSGSVALITVTGRRSGREHTFPVNYHRRDHTVRIEVGWPERKLWWRNLTGDGAEVRLVLAGEALTGYAIATGDETSGISVEVQLSR